MPQRPEEVVREVYARYARRDVDGIFELIAPDVEILQTPELPWGGRHLGLAGARTFFASLSKHTEALPEPSSFITAGEDVAVHGRLRGKARQTGAVIDLEIVHVWTVRDGRVVRFAAYIDTPAMLRALGAPTEKDAGR